MPGDARRDSYDVVVVGAGLGGLSAAASLARLGKSVLVVEQHDGPGGYAHAFRRGEYTIDPAIHWTAQAHEGGILDAYLRALGVRDRVEFVRSEVQYGVRFPGLASTYPTGVDEFIEANARDTEDPDGFEQFIRVCVDLTHESRAAGIRVGLRDLDDAVKQFPLAFKYRMATAAEVIDEFVHDERARALCGAIWPHLGVPPSRASFSVHAGQLVATLEDGPFYPRGSLQRLADALVTAIEQADGELVYGTSVISIDAARDRITGVTLETGQTVAAETVVSNADGTWTYEHLAGIDALPQGVVRQLRRLTPSISAFLVYVATTLDVRDLGHEVFLYRHWDHDQTFQDVLAGRPGGMWTAIPTIHDPSLAPPGEHLIVLSSLALYDSGSSWQDDRDRWTELMLDELEAMIPGIRDALTFLDCATPLTLERHTRNLGGAMYGWELTPAQSLGKRLRQRTPIEGLFLAGHWSEPGSGSLRVIYSGIGAAQAITGIDDLPEFLAALGA
jgi:phytoene desaturase